MKPFAVADGRVAATLWHGEKGAMCIQNARVEQCDNLSQTSVIERGGAAFPPADIALGTIGGDFNFPSPGASVVSGVNFSAVSAYASTQRKWQHAYLSVAEIAQDQFTRLGASNGARIMSRIDRVCESAPA